MTARKNAASAKGLFKATKRKPRAKNNPRDPLDFDPTPEDVTQSFLAQELPHILAHGSTVWENAVGAGHMARPLAAAGLTVIGSDIYDRGWPGTILRPLGAFDGLHANMGRAPSAVVVTNPPFNLTSARDGHGFWVRHCLGLGVRYLALLLGSDWSAARINGHDQLFHDCPPSLELLCCWKIDFRGLGNAPQRNSFFIWDTNRPAMEPDMWPRKRLYRIKGDLAGCEAASTTKIQPPHGEDTTTRTACIQNDAATRNGGFINV